MLIYSLRMKHISRSIFFFKVGGGCGFFFFASKLDRRSPGNLSPSKSSKGGPHAYCSGDHPSCWWSSSSHSFHLSHHYGLFKRWSWHWVPSYEKLSRVTCTLSENLMPQISSSFLACHLSWWSGFLLLSQLASFPRCTWWREDPWDGFPSPFNAYILLLQIQIQRS